MQAHVEHHPHGPPLVPRDDERVGQHAPHYVVARRRNLGLVGQEHPGLAEQPVPFQREDLGIVVDVRRNEAATHLVQVDHRGCASPGDAPPGAPEVPEASVIQPGEVVAPYVLLVQGAAQVGQLGYVGVGQVGRVAAGLGGAQDHLGQRLGVERPDHRLLDTCPGRGHAMAAEHADRRRTHRGEHLVGQLGPADQYRAPIDRYAVAGHPHRGDVERADRPGAA